MPVTQQDIASHLGISSRSVARALAGQGKVSEATRRLVIGAARELGYSVHSNAPARIMAARRHGRSLAHGTIGCALSPPEERAKYPYWAQLQNGVEEGVAARGQRVLLLPPDGSGLESIDGAIIHGDLPWDRINELPLVSIMEPRVGMPSVLVDNYAGACAATRHLTTLGHSRIACLMNPEGSISVRERIRGWKNTMKQETGKAPPASWQRLLDNYGGDFRARGYYAVTRWLASDWSTSAPTALLVQNDQAAIGAMRALAEAGLRVPADVSVIGFDGADECEIVSPRLTSVEVPLREVGRVAVETLARLIDGDAPVSGALLPVQLHIRESTGPPP